MSQVVMADAQFGNAKILRPASTYKTIPVAQQGCTNFVMLAEDGQIFDESIGQEGYDTRLLRGLPVPMGARVQVWLPALTASGIMVLENYYWLFAWRMRNLYDYRMNRIPFHFPRQAEGVTDTTPVTGGPRVVLPCAMQATIYNQAETAATAPEIQHLKSELYQVPSIGGLGVAGTTVNGVFGQGYYDPNVFGTQSKSPAFVWHEMQAIGDELLVGVARAGVAGASWAFASVDQELASFFDGSLMAGVYVMVGSAP